MPRVNRMRSPLSIAIAVFGPKGEAIGVSVMGFEGAARAGYADTYLRAGREASVELGERRFEVAEDGAQRRGLSACASSRAARRAMPSTCARAASLPSSASQKFASACAFGFVTPTSAAMNGNGVRSARLVAQLRVERQVARRLGPLPAQHLRLAGRRLDDPGAGGADQCGGARDRRSALGRDVLPDGQPHSARISTSRGR